MVEECIRRAEKAGYPWIVLLGGDYYSRVGFESGRPYGITVPENEFENDHLQILFLNESENIRYLGNLFIVMHFMMKMGICYRAGHLKHVERYGAGVTHTSHSRPL